MVRWDWTKNAWECECGVANNHALANFCARCGAPITDKAASVAAPIGPSEDCPSEEHFVPLRSPDVLLNIFGVALVVDKVSGNTTAFPDPLFRESRSFDLPRIDKGIDQVRFDPWWVYALDAQGTLFVFPTSALSDEYMARNTQWRLCAEKVHKFWLFKDRLLVLGEEGREIKIGNIPSIPNFWAEEEMDYKPIKMETPFEVETLVPLHGRNFQAALVGKNKMALLSDESISKPCEVSLDGDHWIGSNRENMPRLATRLGNGEVGVVSFQRDQILPDVIPDLRATALYTIDIDGQGWFVGVTSDRIHLIDPLKRESCACREVSMNLADMCTSFGNLVAGFQDSEVQSGLQMALFRFDRHEISRLHAWAFKTGLTPVTAPTGFGNRVYVLMKESNITKLYCYSLSGDGKA